MKTEKKLESVFLGCMVGSALGDAIGELAFSYSAEKKLFAKVAALPVLEYTDDTAMSIGVAESLAELGRVDVHHLGETFRLNFEREPNRGYGAGPPMIFSLIRRGFGYEEAAKRMFSGTGSFGNGAAMRVAPVGLFFHDNPGLSLNARTSAVVTHAHPLGIDGAVVLARAVAIAAGLDYRKRFPVRDFCNELHKAARTPEFKQLLKLVAELVINGSPASEAADVLGRGISAQESVPFAIFSFLKSPGSFEECLRNAVLSGGDRDTLGAMACAISGACLGIETIPSEWRSKLENRAYIEPLALKLLERSQATNP